MSKLVKETDDYCNVPCPENTVNKQCHMYFKTYKTRNTSIFGYIYDVHVISDLLFII